MMVQWLIEVHSVMGQKIGQYVRHIMIQNTVNSRGYRIIHAPVRLVAMKFMPPLLQ